MVRMKKYKLLITSSVKKQKSSIICILLLMLMVGLCMFSSVILITSGEKSVSGEMDRLGFGDFTTWVSGFDEQLSDEIRLIPEVEQVEVQPLVFAGYEIAGSYSDNEGQLIVYDGTVPYKFISEDGSEEKIPEIKSGEIYISPAMKSSFDVDIGSTINFELSRKNGIKSFTVAGYFEDAFMGSSMIDMKSFLVSQEDLNECIFIVFSSAEYDVLGKAGAMLHVFKQTDSPLSESEFQRLVYTESSLSKYTEFSYGKESILSYMLLLQNILTGFLLAFSVILLIICLIVIAHSLSAVIEQNKKDMAILKTMGLPGSNIRMIYIFLYGGTVVLGLIAGFAISLIVSETLAGGLITSTGLLIGVDCPYGLTAIIFIGLIMISAAFIYLRTYGIIRITPMQTIQNNSSAVLVKSPIVKKSLSFSLAVREIMSGKKKYAGVCLISAVLVLFLSIVGKMGTWLGANGEGLMNAFSVAEHDLGVQPFNDTVPMDEVERVINWYSPVSETYELAMQSVTLNGQEYTANVLDETKYFHVLEGNVCGDSEILITHTVANEQGLSIGDMVEIAASGRTKQYVVSGIYQCANGMGTNIGMSIGGYSKIGNINAYIWCHHYILENGDMRDFAMEYLQNSYRGIDVHTNSWSGLSGIVLVMHILILIIYIITAVFILISVYLTATRLLQSETGNMAIYKSLGLSASELRLSFSLRFLITVVIGSLAGMILSVIFSDSLIGAVFRSFGIGSVSSGFGFLGSVLPVIATAFLFFGFAWLSSAKIKQVSLVELINENED